MASAARARAQMVSRQLAARDIVDRRVLDAMGEVPREHFVAPSDRGVAYEDHPLPIGEGQTISQPYIVALMAQAAEIGAGDRVLEVGAGSGYSAAVLGRLGGRVDTIERHAGLAADAARRLDELGEQNVTVHLGDGTLGWDLGAPFDAVIVAASGPSIPPALIAQLAPGGRLVMPVASPGRGERLARLRLPAQGGPPVVDDLGAVAFVPLIGAQGWPDDEGT